MAPRDPRFDDVCRSAANIAMQSDYDRHVGINVMPLEPAHFAIMQHGVNHIAAQTSETALPPSDVATGRRWKAMERA